MKLNPVVSIELVNYGRNGFIVKIEATPGPRELPLAIDRTHRFGGPRGLHDDLLAGRQ
jgi:hypothetical protein